MHKPCIFLYYLTWKKKSHKKSLVIKKNIHSTTTSCYHVIIILYLLIILKRKKQTNLRIPLEVIAELQIPETEIPRWYLMMNLWWSVFEKIFWILLLILLNINQKMLNIVQIWKIHKKYHHHYWKKKKSVIKPKKKILLNCHDEPRLLKTFSLIYKLYYISIWSLHQNMLFFSLLGSYLFHKWELWC